VVGVVGSATLALAPRVRSGLEAGVETGGVAAA